MPNESVTIKTGISQPQWILSGESSPSPACRVKVVNHGIVERGAPISWLDELLEGGLVLPAKDGPLVILVEGPPGAGKSTFCMELCETLTRQRVLGAPNGKPNKADCLYVSTDTDSDSIVRNYLSIHPEPYDTGIPAEKQGCRHVYSAGTNQIMKDGYVSVLGRDRKGLGDWAKPTENVIEILAAGVPAPFPYGALKKAIEKFLKEALWRFAHNKASEFPVPAEHLTVDSSPWLVCFDSLNVIPHNMAGQEFERILAEVSKDTKIAIFVIDGPGEGGRELWQYSADMIIRLGEDRRRRNYYLRTFEIVKARYQSHAWGTHQLKIYAPRDSSSGQSAPEYAKGGIYIVPSMHFHLSRYRRQAAHQMSVFSDGAPTKIRARYPKALGELLALPEGQCTAFVGARSAHKSHIAYAELLRHVVQQQEAHALILSLRDDEPAIEKRLETIQQQEFPSPSDDWKKRIEWKYFHPGYITAEEFFHRVYLRLNQLKSRSGVRPMVLFNSLDQLRARFPLCADEDIFVPALVEMMCSEGATSIFVAVTDKDQPEAQFGLLPMAEQIVSFESHEQKVSKIEAALDIKGAYGAPADALRTVVRVSIARARAGQKAGTGGVLDLITKEVLHAAPNGLRTRVQQGLYFKRESDDWWLS